MDCLNCRNEAKKEFATEVWERPFDAEPVVKEFCSEECCEDYLYGGDFSYFTCSICEREVCGQNPSNGWHVQRRELDDEPVCLKCYEEHILEHGIDREKFEERNIAGMFFSGDNREPLNAGYSIVDGFYNYHITDKDSVIKFCAKALSLIYIGYKVVVGYERLAIGGGEGYVTLFSKMEG